MKIHYFQHAAFEGLGSLATWCRQPGNSLTATKFFEDQKLPFVDICDFLIILGGPMGAYDEDKFPWLKKEKEFIEKALEKGKKVVGICLGAQLLADVLGSKVYKNKEKEIGWFPLQLTAAGKSNPVFSGFPQNQTVFHWHGDTFDLPKNAIHLARTEGCEQQAFLYNNQALGLQFHCEMRKEDIYNMLLHCKGDITPGPYVSDEASLKSSNFIDENNQLIIHVLNNFVNS